jgi:hypothetical protein
MSDRLNEMNSCWIAMCAEEKQTHASLSSCGRSMIVDASIVFPAF